MSGGMEKIKELREGGYSEEEITKWEAATRAKLSGGGFNVGEVDNYFGQGPINYAGMDDRFTKQAEAVRTQTEAPEGQDLNVFEAINAGYQSSITGAIARGEGPDLVLGEDEDLWDMVAFSLAQTVGDLPVSIPAFIAGAFPGAAAGAAAGAPLGPIVATGGAIFGGAISGGAASGFITADIREGLLQFYEENEGNDVGTREFAVGLVTAMMGDRALDAAKTEGLIGAATGLAGPLARTFARPIGSRAATELVVSTAEMTAAVGTISAIEGRMPTKQDFALAAGAVATFKAGEFAFRRTSTGDRLRASEDKFAKDMSTKIQKNLADIYAKTGESPGDVAHRAEADPVLRQQLIADESKIAPGSDVTKTAPKETHLGEVDVVEDLVINEADIHPDNAADIGPNDPMQTKFMDAGKPAVPEIPKVRDKPPDLPAQVEAALARGISVKDIAKVIDENTQNTQAILSKIVVGKDGNAVFTGPRPTDKEAASSQMQDDMGISPTEPPEPPKDGGGDDGAGDGGDPTPEQVVAARDSVRGMIKGEKMKRFGTDDFRYNFINDLQFMVSASEKAFQAETGKRLAMEQNPGELARLAAGAHGIADLEIKTGIFDPDTGKKVSDGLAEIVGRIDKDDRMFFNEYQVSKRVVEKEGQGLKTGFDLPSAEVLVKAGDAKPEFKKAQAEIQEWHDANVTRLVESGLLSEKRAGAMKELNQDFVPFFRLMFDEGQSPSGVTSRGIPVRNPVGKFKGSAKPILNPYEVMVKNRYATIQLAENNIARARLVEFNNDLSPDNQFVTRIGKPRSMIKDEAVDNQFKEWLNDNGLDPSDAPEFATYWSLGKQLAKDEFIVYEGGDPIVYRAADPDLVRSLSALDGGSQNMVFRFLAVPSAIMRSGTVLSPDFISRATIRDNLSSVLLNAFEVVPIGDAIVGVKSLLSKDADFIKWIEAGGANAALLDLDKNILSNGMLDEKTMRTLNLGSVWNAATTPYRMLAYVSTLMENSMRLGQFKRSMKKGETLQTSALRGRDVSLDFHRMGAQVRAWNSISAFLGASINGMERTVASFTKNPKSTFVKSIALLTLPSILLWWANKDEEWYKNLPEWRKATFWSFRVGGTDDNPSLFHLPMPLVYGTMFGYTPVKILDAYANETPGAFEDISKQLIKSFSLDVMPVGTSPLIDIATNHNSFTERPLVSNRAERSLLPEYRYTPYTTEVAKELAKFLSVFQGVVPERSRTPIAIEHLVSQWSGALGTAALRTVDKGLQIAGIVDTQERPTNTRIPVIKGFFSRHLDGRGQIEDFYKHANKLDQIMGTIDALELEERFDEADTLEEKFDNVIMKTSRDRRAINNLYNAARGIAMEPGTPPEEKRQLVDDLMQDIIWIAEDFNEEFAISSKEQ